MLRAKDLRNRSVVDLDRAGKIGTIEDLLLNPRTSEVNAILVNDGPNFPGRKPPILVPAVAVDAFGEDVVTVDRNRARGEAESGDTEGLVKLSEILGRRVVTRGGKLVGSIEDVVLGAGGTRIVGYALRQRKEGSGLESLLGVPQTAQAYLRADVELRLGEDLLIAPDDAVLDEAGFNQLAEQTGRDRHSFAHEREPRRLDSTPESPVRSRAERDLDATERLLDDRATRRSGEVGDDRVAESSESVSAQPPVAEGAQRTEVYGNNVEVTRQRVRERPPGRTA